MSATSDATGLVLRIDAKVCHVDVDGRTVHVPLRGRLFEDRGVEKNPVAVGDHVRLILDAEGDGAIEAVLPRTSTLARRASGDQGRVQVIAANVTRVLIVASIKAPPLQPVLIDRILAGAERQDIETVIALTKIDLDKKRLADEWVELYRELGYVVFPTSIAAGKETASELDGIRALLQENVTVLSGLSGVGKSSLLNHLVPGLHLRVGSMSRILQGKHTTTFTQLIPLPGGGHVLDTPGIRNFGLFGVDPHELTFWFREFATPARDCNYRNCTHLGEPDCAVLAAVEDGTIHPSRFESYARMFDELSDAEER